ncbi:MAG: glycosyltransferase [bacterium]|nr:glycosyltransferase [bacterium]
MFIKSPMLGTVKTRLAKDIGDEKALFYYKNFVINILKTLRNLNVDLKIFYTGKEVISWLGDNYSYVEQEGESLGDRMHHAFKFCFDSGYEKAVIIGSDLPSISIDTINLAFRKEVVIGPCFDGGYYLLGFSKNKFNSKVFENIDWSTAKVFKQTMVVLKDENIFCLDKERDIDTLEDLMLS